MYNDIIQNFVVSNVCCNISRIASCFRILTWHTKVLLVETLIKMHGPLDTLFRMDIKY